MNQAMTANEEMLKRIIRHKELKQTEGVPLMFIDSSLDRHYRINYSLIGATASENDDYKPFLTQPHKFHVGMVKAPQLCGPAYHTHDYIESFMPLTGKWRFYFGNSPDEIEGETIIEPWDFITLPAGLWRGFENITEKEAWIFAVVEDHPVFEAKDPYWPEAVVEEAEKLGMKSDENGKMIKPDNFKQMERELYEKVIRMMTEKKSGIKEEK
ncbi:cupin domain-containing protein [Peribacillus muralis]|uniref:cupin domain-containing protein n=1 Tax=Peribacillus muralis TaxID=264697 RepID=UPI000AA89051|nr:cupin domain-containing protein [Peribacillus muralis]